MRGEKIHRIAYRVPTTTVSIVDFTAEVGTNVTADDVNNAYKEASPLVLFLPSSF